MEENYLFGKSCLNLALTKPLHFISAYPSIIIFGKCSPTGFITSKCFQYQLFELHKLYCALFEIVKYFALTNNFLEKQLILSKCNENYFLAGKVLWINDEEKKVVVFGLEQLLNDGFSVVYELFFTDIELNNFIYTLIKIIPSSLCLTSQELVLFQKVSKESSKIIILFRKEKHSKLFVTEFLKNSDKETSDVLIYNLSTMLSYYCEIILIAHKIETLFNNEIQFDNIQTIIEKV